MHAPTPATPLPPPSRPAFACSPLAACVPRTRAASSSRTCWTLASVRERGGGGKGGRVPGRACAAGTMHKLPAACSLVPPAPLVTPPRCPPPLPGAIVYYCLGWGFAGLLVGDANGFIGTSQFALTGGCQWAGGWVAAPAACRRPLPCRPSKSAPLMPPPSPCLRAQAWTPCSGTTGSSSLPLPPPPPRSCRGRSPSAPPSPPTSCTRSSSSALCVSEGLSVRVCVSEGLSVRVCVSESSSERASVGASEGASGAPPRARRAVAAPASVAAPLIAPAHPPCTPHPAPPTLHPPPCTPHPSQTPWSPTGSGLPLAGSPPSAPLTPTATTSRWCWAAARSTLLGRAPCTWCAGPPLLARAPCALAAGAVGGGGRAPGRVCASAVVVDGGSGLRTPTCLCLAWPPPDPPRPSPTHPPFVPGGWLCRAGWRLHPWPPSRPL